MSFKRILSGLITGGITCFLLIFFFRLDFSGFTVSYNAQYENQSNTQIFYSDDKDNYTEEQSFIFNVEQEEDTGISSDVSGKYRYLRIDLGDVVNNVEISDVCIRYRNFSAELTEEMLVEKHDIGEVRLEDGTYRISTQGEDAYLVFDLNSAFDKIQEKTGSMNRVLVILYIIIAVIVFIITYIKYNILADDVKWLLDIFRESRLIKGLAINDFKMRYASSYLGVFWAFVQPVVTVTIYSVIFGLGFKSLPVEGISFALWLTVGIVPWFFFSEALTNATNALLEYSYLVKKMVFKVNILPMVKIVSAVFIHVFFIAVAVVMQLITERSLSIYIVQVVYYTLCTMVLTLGLAYITSAVVVFFKDLGQIVNIILQFGMWATPIMYPVTMFGSTVAKILKFNPMFYIVDGYRDAFFQEVWFWEKPQMGIYFWVVAIFVLLIGIKIFRSLEKHFADVL